MLDHEILKEYLINSMSEFQEFQDPDLSIPVIVETKIHPYGTAWKISPKFIHNI